VQDNGSGISRENYESIALKHYTSKLSSYDGISSLQTFGFRGEALSSLCALSHLSIVTCLASEAPRGSRLKFAHSGKLDDTSVVSAKQGTTVIVENLFHNLPVRRRELERHVKREWNKLIALLNQYACILTRVRFTVSQQAIKGKKVVLFSTNGNLTTRENVINIFGAKSMSALVALDLSLTMDPSSSGPGRKILQGIVKDGREDSRASQVVAIRGHVSRPAHGEGRQTPDRQMFFVNGRPCGLPQFAKVFNEVYKSFNNSQSPFILADVQLDTHLYDVNVSPDKRTIMLHEQGRMLENLKEELNALFEQQDYKVPAAQLTAFKPTLGSRAVSAVPPTSTRAIPSIPTRNAEEITSDTIEDEDDIASDNENSQPETTISPAPMASPRMFNLLSRRVARESSAKPETSPNPVSPGITTARELIQRLGDRLDDAEDDMYSVTPPRARSATGISSREPSTESNRPPSRRDRSIPTTRKPQAARPSFGNRLSQLFSATASTNDSVMDLKAEMEEIVIEENEATDDSASLEGVVECQDETDQDCENEVAIEGSAADNPSPEESSPQPWTKVVDADDDQVSAVVAETDEPEVRVAREALDEPQKDKPVTMGERQATIFKGTSKSRDPTFQYEQRLRISKDSLATKLASWSSSLFKPDDFTSSDSLGLDAGSADAEEKLSLTISKGDFAKMKIIGQFNLGFVLAVRPGDGPESIRSGDSREDELFIVDQHASDEKYNFERLQACTVVQSQRLVHPKTLDLTALEEEIVLDNGSALEANGFKITVDESGDQPVGSRCQLLALPLSKETTFTLADLEELISLLGDSHIMTDSAAAVPRPSKVRKMFATRACRSSIMIGKALQQRQMERLVRHMGELDKPWNCPHGRPTMRHLSSLASWHGKQWDEDRQASALAGLDTSWQKYLDRKQGI